MGSSVWLDVYIDVADSLFYLDDVEDGYWHDRLVAIVGAAVRLGEAICSDFESCFARIGPITADRAWSVSAVTSLAMGSRWMRNWFEQDPSLDRPRAWRALTLEILRVFDEDNDQRYEESWWLDVQFNDDRETQRVLGIEMLLVAILCAREAGAVWEYRLSSPPMPFPDSNAIATAGWELPVGMDFTTLSDWGLLTSDFLAAEAAMYKGFQSLRDTRG